jgi:hypothetical protein
LEVAYQMRDNKSVNTDPQLQEAAAPQRLWSGYRQR